MVGDFNVAPDHTRDTLGYLHVNNPNTRRFIDRMKSLNMMTDVYRHKHPDLRQFTFSKRQAKNYTKARLDYFLINDDALDLVKKVGLEKNLLCQIIGLFTFIFPYPKFRRAGDSGG